MIRSLARSLVSAGARNLVTTDSAGPAPVAEAVEILASLVDMWNLQGASDLSSEINAYAMVASGDGTQNVTSQTGPNGLADNAVSIGGSTTNVLGMAADNAAFDIADDDAWWAAAVYLVSTTGTIVMWGKGTAWRLVRSGGITYAQSPSTVSATGPTLGTGTWKVLVGWRVAASNKVYLDVDGTVYESPGSGVPGDVINAVRMEGGATMRYARVAFGKGAYLSASARAYLQNSNSGRLYASIVADANP